MGKIRNVFIKQHLRGRLRHQGVKFLEVLKLFEN